MASRRKMESEMVMRDLDKVIELSPTFVYAYFNRASVSAGMNNFDAALADLNKAIELYPSFAEAYYNRGLIFLRTGKTKAGVSDLSKAGELGLAAAYSVLKRANN
jgi:tetratricopeptide (TPR) repeat protein